MKGIIILSIYLFFIFNCNLIYSEKSQNKKGTWNHRYEISEIKEDFLQMQNLLKKMHPALYNFISKYEFNNNLKKNMKLLNKPLTLLEFNKMVSKTFAKIGCGHSIVVVPKSFRENSPDRWFPLELRFLNNKAFIYSIYNENQNIPLDSEIIAINHISIKKILNNLSSIMFSDGNRNPYKISQLNSKFLIYYMYYYYFPKEYLIEYIAPGEKKARHIILNSINRYELNKHKKRVVNETSNRPNLEFTLDKQKKVAVITIKSFGYYGDKRHTFKHYLDNAFLRIKNNSVNHLIIDLRGNNGGDPYCANHLLSYLAKSPIVYFSKGYNGYKQLALPTPLAANNYSGMTYILIDSGGFSTTGHISALLKYHHIGTLIGTQTGAGFECNDSTKIVRLKNTGLELYIATKTYSAAVKDMKSRKRVIPDIILEPTIKEILKKEDTTLLYVMNLIKKGDVDEK